jgi:aspartate aminotransferase
MYVVLELMRLKTTLFKQVTSLSNGAFYVFPVVTAYFGKKNGEELIKDADDLCMYLLNTAHVSTVTGRAFGEPTCIRISFANSMGKIEEAMSRITKAMLDLS